MKRTTLIALALTLISSAPVHAQETPACVQTCQALEAKGALRNGVSVEGCKVRVCQEDGRRHYKETNYAESIASLNEVNGPLRNSPAYALDRGLTLYALGQFEESLTNFDIVVANFEDSLRAGAQRAHALVRLRRYDDAKAQFSKLLETPAAQRTFRSLRTESYLKGNLGVTHVLESDLGSARKMLEDAIKIDGRNSQASIFLHQVIPAIESGELQSGGAHLLLAASEDTGLKQYQRATDSLEMLIESSPKFGTAYHLQAEILVSFEKFKTCEDALERGVKARPGDVDIRAEQLRCRLLRVGPTSREAEPVVAELKKLRKTHPDNERVWQILHMLDRS